MKAQPITVYLPDTRGVEVSSFGKGNAKIGADVYTYSRLPMSTCPGATAECKSICYALRVRGPVLDVWKRNSNGTRSDIPTSLPEDCRLLRLHISGDFSSVGYIRGWRRLLAKHPEVTAWCYTRSWRVTKLIPELEALRALPNVQMFASMDVSTQEIPPPGWRRAWIDGDPRANVDGLSVENRRTVDGAYTLVCPEQTERKRDCQSCRYCFDGKRGDVTFLRH